MNAQRDRDAVTLAKYPMLCGILQLEMKFWTRVEKFVVKISSSVNLSKLISLIKFVMIKLSFNFLK